jgi:hypothetical protein
MACSPRQATGDINLIGFIPLLLDIVPNILLSSKTVFIEIHIELHVSAVEHIVMLYTPGLVLCFSCVCVEVGISER